MVAQRQAAGSRAPPPGTGVVPAQPPLQMGQQQLAPTHPQHPSQQPAQGGRYVNGVPRTGAPNGVGPLPGTPGVNGTTSFPPGMMNGMNTPPGNGIGVHPGQRPMNQQQPQRPPNGGVGPGSYQPSTMATSPQNGGQIAGGQPPQGSPGSSGSMPTPSMAARNIMPPPSGMHQNGIAPGQGQGQGPIGFNGMGRPPSNPSSPGQPGMMPGPSPSLAPRQTSGFHDDLGPIPQEVLNQAKAELGLQDKPMNALTPDDKVVMLHDIHVVRIHSDSELVHADAHHRSTQKARSEHGPTRCAGEYDARESSGWPVGVESSSCSAATKCANASAGSTTSALASDSRPTTGYGYEPCTATTGSATTDARATSVSATGSARFTASSTAATARTTATVPRSTAAAREQAK